MSSWQAPSFSFPTSQNDNSLHLPFVQAHFPLPSLLLTRLEEAELQEVQRNDKEDTNEKTQLSEVQPGAPRHTLHQPDGFLEMLVEQSKGKETES